MIGQPAQPSLHPGTAELAVDLTPLLDVLFMVLVFFLLTTNGVPIALQLELPRESSNSAQPVSDNELIRLEIRAAQPAWRVNGQDYPDWEQARAALLVLHQQTPDTAIAIAGERTAPLEHMVKVLAFLKQQQIPTVELLLDPGKQVVQSKSSQSGVGQP